MNFYQTITDRILEQLEAGVVPWHKTWAAGLPKSLATGKEYRGINLLILGGREFTSRYWLTYREALKQGGHVRKAERATPAIYWKWRTPEELTRRSEETGVENPAPCVPFVSAVFNLDQVEGVSRPDDDAPIALHRRLEIADQLLSVMPDKPEIVHSATSDPAYCPSADQVVIPHLSQFESADEYYSTLFHELIHSTGHSKRLDRFTQTGGDPAEKYSFEELVAEFGAAFLCGFGGIVNANTEALQASYIEGWKSIFREDNSVLFRAASGAQRAADYCRGKIPVTEPTLTPVVESPHRQDGAFACADR